jgi:hypothetical protein
VAVGTTNRQGRLYHGSPGPKEWGSTGTVRKLSWVNDYKFGPEPDGTRYGIECQGKTQPGQLWLKEWAPNREYAIGRHWGCISHNDDHNTRPSVREYCLCGGLSRNAREAALHFRLIHRITKPVGAVTLLK